MENESGLKDEQVLSSAENGAAGVLSDAEAEGSAAGWNDHASEAEEALTLPAVDYATLDKKGLVNLLKEVASANDYRRAELLIRDIKPIIDEMRNHERAEALARFKLDGGIEEDFEFRADEWDTAFDIYVKSIRESKQRYFREMEEKKNANFNQKKVLLERLRELVDSEDTEHSLRNFKEIQKEWKGIGAVPQNEAKTLWANYNALVDRFYDQRSIYFELKELDRKKNLELKRELVTRAEQLLTQENVAAAVRELNELHNEFKHIGPVPLEEKEKVWVQFKAASDAIYGKRDEVVATVLKELQANLIEKQKLNEEILPFGEFASDRIKEWNQKTKEILDLQKRWEAIGGVPRSHTREVNRKFWHVFKTFFHNKNVFFKKLDAERQTNLQLKTELLNKAIALKESQDWEKASNELKTLQHQWKEIGPVPEKQREKIFQQFKEACDFFFEQRRASMSQADREQLENLTKKEAIITNLTKLTAEGAITLEEIKSHQSQFQAIGFVPKSAANSIKNRLAEAVTKAIAALPLSAKDKQDAALDVQLAGFRNNGNNGDRKTHHKEVQLRRQIAKAENDLAVLRNNLEFFGRSKNAEKLKEEFNEKIRLADEDLKHLKKQLQLVQAS